MKKVLLFTLLSLLAFASCSKEDDMGSVSESEIISVATSAAIRKVSGENIIVTSAKISSKEVKDRHTVFTVIVDFSYMKGTSYKTDYVTVYVRQDGKVMNVSRSISYF